MDTNRPAPRLEIFLGLGGKRPAKNAGYIRISSYTERYIAMAYGTEGEL